MIHRAFFSCHDCSVWFQKIRLPSIYENPTDASYVFGGAYIPLSCSAISHVLTKGSWTGLQDVIKNWEGPAFSEDQTSVRKDTKKNYRIVLVYFIGGVTFSEISALRFLGSKLKCHFIIATTDIINWRSVLQSFVKMEISLDD